MAEQESKYESRAYSRKIRVAAIQNAPKAFDLAASITKLDSLVQEASLPPHEASLVVLPEAFLSCYPRGMDFGAVIGSRSPEGREWFSKYYDSSIDIEGNSTEWKRVLEISQKYSVILVLGVIEKDPSRHGTLFCTAVTIGRDGTLLAKRRKLMPTGTERLVWGQGDGSSVQVAATDVGKIGTVICWENYMPLLRYAMYSLGVEIYCAPTADGRPGWASTIQHIATEGRCFVISVNQFATRGDYPWDYPAFNTGSKVDVEEVEVVSRGGSMIVGPLGDVLAGPLWDKAGILCVEIDLEDISRAKFDFDPVGHYSRPDIFRLHVNDTPHTGFSTSTGSL